MKEKKGPRRKTVGDASGPMAGGRIRFDMMYVDIQIMKGNMEPNVTDVIRADQNLPQGTVTLTFRE